MPRPAASLRRDDIVLVSFPFSDLSGRKLRPALVVGRPSSDDTVLAFITSQDGEIESKTEHLIAPGDPEFATTGLKVGSRVRLTKLATLHRSLVRRRLGRIGPRSRIAVADALRYVLEL